LIGGTAQYTNAQATVSGGGTNTQYLVSADYASENLLRQRTVELQVLEDIADAFYMVDAAWHFTYVNQAYEKLQHSSRQDLLSKNVWQLFPYGKERRYYREYCRALLKQVAVHFQEFNPHSGMWV